MYWLGILRGQEEGESLLCDELAKHLVGVRNGATEAMEFVAVGMNGGAAPHDEGEMGKTIEGDALGANSVAVSLGEV